MTNGIDRRRFLELAMAGTLAACGGGDDAGGEPSPPPDSQIDKALGALDGIANDLLARTGVPGMAIAVVRGEHKVYAKGFGNRIAELPTPVDADTAFQVAGISEAIAATVVAKQIGFGRVSWDTPLRRYLPAFALADPRVSDEVTLGDMYAHRSGLPQHAGDRLEDVGYERSQILDRLRYLPLAPFRKASQETSFGTTAGAEALSAMLGVDWVTLAGTTLLQPLAMNRTSFRYRDFLDRTNRARGHVLEDGKWLLSTLRRDPTAQLPASGASSSANDMAAWLAMMLGEGAYQGARIVDAAALDAATSPQIETAPGSGSHFGYGFAVDTSPYGRAGYSRSGGFSLGASAMFRVIPSTGLGIVALTNGWPIGVPEALGLAFFDIVQTGSVQRDWYADLAPAFAANLAPEGSLVGAPRPAHPAPPSRPLGDFTGSYANAYHGPAHVTLQGGTLYASVGPGPERRPLEHWDGDVFAFTLYNENALPGTISKATFDANQLTLEWFDQDGVGTFVR